MPFLVAVCCLLQDSAAQPEETQQRDPWQWPFSSQSIWNMPMGSGAHYRAANLPAPRAIGCDIEWHLRTTADDPIVAVYSPSSWERRWPGDRHLGELRIPADLIIPDAAPPHTPNACAVFLMPDGRTIRQIEPACRPEKEPRIVGWLHPDAQDLYGPGIKGTHYGSGLSALGGSIRRGELLSDDPIRHALKINIWGKYLYYGEDVPGYRWPADRCDSYAAQRYLGDNPSLVMGTLLALPPLLTAEQLDVRTEVGLKIFHALQDYGAYISEDSAWDAVDLCVELGVPEEVQDRYGYAMTEYAGPYVEEMKRMVTALMIVDNNREDQVAGGGTPRRPLAPALLERTRRYERGCILNWLSIARQTHARGWIPFVMNRDMGDVPADIYAGNMHKPCLAQHAAFLVQEDDGAIDWLREDLMYLQYFINNYRNHHRHPCGLYFWQNDLSIGVDDDPCTAGRPPRSSGSIYLNCLMHRELLALVYLLECAGLDECAASYRDDAEALRASTWSPGWSNVP